jgi:uncharacterized membrane protein YoaK (UPF0700 family)
VNRFLEDVRDTILPRNEPKHGPLPPLMLGLTLVTGLIDAFSYLVLGHVFVANMTGNIVLLGFALVGAPGFSISASLVALAAFFAGATAGGRLGSSLADHRDRLLSTAATIQAVFFAAAVAFGFLSDTPVAGGFRYGLIAVLGMAMGIQNAAARKLAVPDLTTTVLTLTITGIASDNTLVGGPGSKVGRRLIATATMLAGALIGAALVIHVNIRYPLMLALFVIVLVAVASWTLGRSNPAWVRA